jgi:hypothetical protein
MPLKMQKAAGIEAAGIEAAVIQAAGLKQPQQPKEQFNY